MAHHIKSIVALSAIAAVIAIIIHLQMQAHANTEATSRDRGAVLVELFTSEGCSSCPPADALLRQIDGKQTKDGRRIIGISEHVTYWNHLGWSDPFSNEVFTQRQSEYGRRFNLDSVYTPQMVIDGEDQLVGSDHDGLQRELDKSRNSQTTLHIVSIVPQGDALTATYTLAGGSSNKDAELVAVLADDEDRSSVARGENSGRVLTHVSVARWIKHIPAMTSLEEQTLELSIPRSSATSQKQGRRLILFAQEKGQGRVLGADVKPF